MGQRKVSVYLVSPNSKTPGVSALQKFRSIIVFNPASEEHVFVVPHHLVLKEPDMPITQEPLGHGQILWLGVNLERGTFSTAREEILITNDGIADDIYRGLSRLMSGHDVDYFPE